MNKFFRNVGFYLLIIIIAISIIDYYSSKTTTKTEVSYTAFLKQVEDQKVERVTIVDNTIRGKLKDGQEFTLVAPNDPTLINTLREKKIDIKAEQPPQPPWWTTLFSSLLPMLLLIGVWFFIMQQTQGGGSKVMSFGKSRAKLHNEEKIKVTFAEVAGAEEAKEELQEVVEFLKHPKKFNDLGARIPKGVLLFGPPGTGKTLLARAVAGEAGVPFFSISGSDFVEMFVGVGAARVRDLFEQARKSAPAIIFIDELDALGRVRTAAGFGGNDEREQTLNQLLVELDGFDPTVGLVLLAATNRPEVLDPALLRAGRFDRQVLVDRPDKAGRIAILLVHMKKIQLDEDVNAEHVADLTTGFSGADLANLVNEAALLATRRRADKVAMEDFSQAIERIVAGLEKKNRLLNPKERRIVAYHEVGHALTALALPGSDPIYKISIIPRGIGALGYTMQRPTEDRFLMTKEELEYKIAVLLGGRAAEKLVFNHLSTGAADDIAKATDIARNMVTRYGMDDDLGFVVYEENQHNFLTPQHTTGPYGCSASDNTARRIDASVRRIIDDSFALSYRIMERNREQLERCAQLLLQKETLLEAELAELTSDMERIVDMTQPESEYALS